ncbi:CPBP family intramembrane glutamic endopeptidase [Microbulbifer sp. Q7]|uniref:CPBP family intramembrane glutamic endopeptidase n=1 Tax=Microbulbifer sp. Q7 TaxID=1785091 RepID=UPI00082EB961|nr:type II CAAX endopeptidase family protein [Microbulbifer sp. Q7]
MEHTASSPAGDPSEHFTSEQVVPAPWRATGWLVVFALLHFIGVFFYIAGYGGYLGAQLGAQGQVMDPAVIQAQVAAHAATPGAMAGMYLAQFALILPVLLLVSRFKHQSAGQTLAIRAFPVNQILPWLAVLAAFLATQFIVYRLFEIDAGDFMQTLAGSKHLLLALVLVIAAPLLEELVFRGYLFQAWRNTRLGFSGTLLLTSVLFTLLHWGQYNLVQLGFIFAFALILGFTREKSGSVLLPMLLHLCNNLVAAIVVLYLGIL